MPSRPEEEIIARRSPDTPEFAAKRRKLRKGTWSCWECKRRKIRCVSAASAHGVACLGCQRRNVPCVGQEMPEDPAPATVGNRHLSERISRVEKLLLKVLGEEEADGTSCFGGQERDEGTECRSGGAATALGREPTPLNPTRVRNPSELYGISFPLTEISGAS